METMGSLIDKLTIEKIRFTKLSELAKSQSAVKRKVTLEKTAVVTEKVNDLKDEIDTYYYALASGTMKGKVKDDKIKVYTNEKPSNLTDLRGFADVIDTLFSANLKLWELEDMRRDPIMPDPIRLNCADEVGKYNRIRNDCMDKINSMIHESIYKKKG